MNKISVFYIIIIIIIILSLFIHSCVQKDFVCNYSEVLNDNSKLILNKNDSTFELFFPTDVGNGINVKGDIVFLSRNRLYLKERTYKIQQIIFPDSLDDNCTFLKVVNWGQWDIKSLRNVFPEFPYEVFSGYQNKYLGSINEDTGELILELGEEDSRMIWISNDGVNDPIIHDQNLRGTAWFILIEGFTNQLNEDIFHLKIKNGYIKNKRGSIYFPEK